MVQLTHIHHDWVRDTLNVDPLVFTQPDADIEAPLDDPAWLKKPRAYLEVSALRQDFSNSVHAACKRAQEAMTDLASIPATWSMDPRTAAAILKKSAPTLTDDRKALLEQDAFAVKSSVNELNNMHNVLEAMAADYEAAAQEVVNHTVKKLEDRPDGEQVVNEDAPNLDGGFWEHLEDGINSVTQMTIKTVTWTVEKANLHLLGGMDLIKDLIKHDNTDDQIKAINVELDRQHDAINGLIEAATERALQKAEQSLTSFGKQIKVVKTQVELVKEAVALFHKHIQTFSTPASGAGGPSKEVKEVLEAYNAIVDAAMASKVACNALDTKTLGPTAYKVFADQMIPLGKPVTDDAEIDGRMANGSLFFKGNMAVEYDQPAAVVEALASGLEDVRLVYANADKLELLYGSWSKAIMDGR